MCLRLLLRCDDDLVLSQAIASNIFIKADQLFRAINSWDFPALETNRIWLLKTRLHLKTRVSHAQFGPGPAYQRRIQFRHASPARFCRTVYSAEPVFGPSWLPTADRSSVWLRNWIQFCIQGGSIRSSTPWKWALMSTRWEETCNVTRSGHWGGWRLRYWWEEEDAANVDRN